MSEDKNLKISVLGIQLAVIAIAISLLSSAMQIILSVSPDGQPKIIISYILSILLITVGITFIVVIVTRD